MGAALNGLDWFYEMRTRFAEGEAVFTQALMKQLEAELPAERVTEAKARSAVLSVDEVVAEILQTENEQSPHTVSAVPSMPLTKPSPCA